jgi:hypothetical protein
VTDFLGYLTTLSQVPKKKVGVSIITYKGWYLAEQETLYLMAEAETVFEMCYLRKRKMTVDRQIVMSIIGVTRTCGAGERGANASPVFFCLIIALCLCS